MNFHWPQSNLSSEPSRRAIRQSILEQIFKAGSGHPGGSLSMVEIITAIFDGNFEQKVNDQFWNSRDRFVLSKGHGVPTLYSVLSFLGYFAPEELLHLREFGHFLQGHPDKARYPLMEASTGSLGQGASVALGLALGLRLEFAEKKLSRLPKVYCVLGDGEIQEGQVWECLMSAAKFRPGNLVFILDYNKGQIDGQVKDVMNLEPLTEKIASFGWDVQKIDGHNVDALKSYFSSITAAPEGTPKFLIADTIKGKGVSFMEGNVSWHGASPSRDELEKAIGEIWGGVRESYPSGRLV